MTGLLEPTNESYSIAKIAGIKLCESYNRQYGKSHGLDYRTIMPTNLYGPGDNYHPLNSHVIPALIRKFHDAKINRKKTIKIWGTGKAKREFLYVDDLARASTHVMNLSKNKYKKIISNRSSHINIGSGYDLSIKELAKIIMKIVNYKVIIKFDTSKPDGVKRKILDSKKINKLGWRPKVDLINGLMKTYKSFKENL
jgi:GDP-L-fucose synthase